MLSTFRSHRRQFQGEAKRTLKIGSPIIAAQLLQMSMSFVDTVMAGNLSASALAAVAIGVSTLLPFFVLAMGTLTAINPIVAQLFGSRRFGEIGREFRQVLWLSALLAIPFMLLFRNLGFVMELANVDPVIIPTAVDYVKAYTWGIPAGFMYLAMRFFCEGLAITKPSMNIALVGVIMNILGNYALMYGAWGFPALGAVGCGYASAIVSWVMFFSMAFFVIRYRGFDRFHLFASWRLPRWKYAKELFRIGIPIGISSTMEVTMFAVVSLLMGSLGEVVIASHQIAINISAMTFMVPFGLSTAITTRVGHSIGRGDWKDARYRGFTGIILAVFFMTLTAIMMFTIPEYIVGIYTSDQQVASIAIQLLYMAAIFQISDGLQVSGYGALRGLKDTKIPMFVNLLAYWIVGLPLGYWLGLQLNWGPQGLWIGLIGGLTVAAILHNIRFFWKTHQHIVA
jgi:MATE family multidrug resistance protein